MNKIALAIIILIALAGAYVLGRAGSVANLLPAARRSASPPPSPAVKLAVSFSHATNCYRFSYPDDYTQRQVDAAACRLTIQTANGDHYATIAPWPGQSVTAATVKAHSTLPSCKAPTVTQYEAGVYRSAFRCPGQTNEWYYVAPSGSRLGTLAAPILMQVVNKQGTTNMGNALFAGLEAKQ